MSLKVLGTDHISTQNQPTARVGKFIPQGVPMAAMLSHPKACVTNKSPKLDLCYPRKHDKTHTEILTLSRRVHFKITLFNQIKIKNTYMVGYTYTI